MIACIFAGHREIVLRTDASVIPNRLRAALIDLINLDTEFQFYFGGMGWFDLLCARTVRDVKVLHPEKRIRLILIQPYQRKIEEKNLYDEILLLNESNNTDCGASIPERTRRLMERCHYMIAYVHRDSGGAAMMLRHASASGLTIWNLATHSKV